MIPPRTMQTLTILSVLFFVASVSAATTCPRPCKCFADDNGIQVANCTDLPDQMTKSWPQKILRIRFDGDRASPVMLKNKAFKHFPRLTYLDITGAPIRFMGSSAFDGLPELVELNLAGTGIRKLHRNVFAGNRKLAFLSLRNNPGLYVAQSFLVSKSVTELDLSECSLTGLKSVYFDGLPELKYLFAEKNQLRTLGPQFGPLGLKYINLAHNRIENVLNDFDVYKRLRTIDLTGNPINCTCELSEIEKKLTSRGVTFENTVTCANTGKPLGEMVEICSDKEMMLGDSPVDMYKEESLLKIDKSAMLQSMEETDEFGSGSGSGDGELITVGPVVQPETKPVQQNHTQPEVVVENTTRAETPVAIVEEQLKKIRIEETFAVPAVTTTTTTSALETESTTSTTTEPSVTTSNVTTTTDGNDTTTAGDEVAVVNVNPPIQTAEVNSSAPIPVGKDREIVPQTIQAPEDNVDVQSKVAEYLKSNIGVTGTALILAVVIIAIVYKAVCSGRRSRVRGGDAANNDKDVELKDIKYTAADTEDRSLDGRPVEENLLLEDRDTDDEEDDGNNGNQSSSRTSSPSSLPALNGHHAAPQNGLLHSVMDAVKNNETPGVDVPARVIVKLCETPKASKAITINNVH